MLVYVAFRFYTLKKMANINIPKGSRIIFSGNRQRAAEFLGIAKRRIHELKQMMRVNGQMMMQKLFYLDRDCVWVRIHIIDSAEFVVIHACSEGGGCENLITFLGSTQTFPSALWKADFKSKHIDENGKRVQPPFAAGIFKWGDTAPTSTKETVSQIAFLTDVIQQHNYTSTGDFTVTLISWMRNFDIPVINNFTLIQTTTSMTLIVDGVDSKQWVGILTWNLTLSGLSPDDLTLTIDGENTVITVDENGFNEIRVIIPQATGNTMTIEFTWVNPIVLPPPVLPSVAWTAYTCIVKSRKTITVA